MNCKSIFFQKHFTLLLTISWLLFSCGSDDETPVDCKTSNLILTTDNVMDASCGLDNGGFELSLSGGTAPFELTIPGLGSQLIQPGASSIDNIPAGNYNISVRDNNNCITNSNVIIVDINNVVIETQVEASGCQTENGTISVSAAGGKEPYMYSLDGGTNQTDNVFTGLAVGDYTALVTDDDGCQTSVTVSLLSGVSYNDNITPIINANCAISGCHDGSNAALPNWTDLETVQANAADIKTRTSDGTMPPAGRPDLKTEEIQAIACWVDDGALNN
jgi:hypothetical protein